MVITTVGDLKEALRHSEDEEPLIFDLKEGEKTVQLECVGVGSSGGGRITVLWLDRKYKPEGLVYNI
jgi:hypothetical protein